MDQTIEYDDEDLAEPIGPMKSSAKNKKKRSKNKSKASSIPEDLSAIRFHKSRAHIISVHQVSGKGRCLIASKDNIAEGTCVYREESKVVISNQKSLCTKCLCFIKCAPILDEYHTHACFCSTACHRAFQPQLEFEQPVVRELCAIARRCDCDLQLLQIVVRILSWSYVDIAKCDDPYFTDNGTIITSTFKGFLALEAHLDMQPASWKESLSRAIDEILPLLPSDLSITPIDILQYAARVNTNAYGCQTNLGDGAVVGVGIFPVIGMTVNHDCYPNCMYSFVNGMLECRALRDIARGEELTVAYIDPFDCFVSRRKTLLTSRFFECRCRRCMAYLNRVAKVALSEHYISYHMLYRNIFQAKGVDQVENDDAILSMYETDIFSGYPDAILCGLYCDKCGKKDFFILVLPTDGRPNELKGLLE